MSGKVRLDPITTHRHPKDSCHYDPRRPTKAAHAADSQSGSGPRNLFCHILGRYKYLRRSQDPTSPVAQSLRGKGLAISPPSPSPQACPRMDVMKQLRRAAAISARNNALAQKGRVSETGWSGPAGTCSRRFDLRGRVADLTQNRTANTN